MVNRGGCHPPGNPCSSAPGTGPDRTSRPGRHRRAPLAARFGSRRRSRFLAVGDQYGMPGRCTFRNAVRSAVGTAGPALSGLRRQLSVGRAAGSVPGAGASGRTGEG
ncbi:hypothetical protein L083_5804 [Actinoplanes sp. N902-109]|nr:hypothetical protein L083_5804 [Actinoplanes sp. N902-109]